jgi:hypothetical protein
MDQKKGEKKEQNKMEGPTSKKTNEAPKRADHKGNIKFPNPTSSSQTPSCSHVTRSISNMEKGEPPERRSMIS